MAKLTDIDIPAASTKNEPSGIPTVTVPGDTVARYNEARDQVDRATEVIDALKPILIEAGLTAVFSHNSLHADDPKALISSVKLESEPDAGDTAGAPPEVCQFSWTKKDLRNTPKQVEAEFNRLRTLHGKKANINDYASYEVVAKFDTDVFKVDGKFDRERYAEFMAALSGVAARFGVDNPLSCTKVLLPHPDFHSRRWAAFDVESNMAIQSVLPTQCNLKPVRPDAGD